MARPQPGLFVGGAVDRDPVPRALEEDGRIEAARDAGKIEPVGVVGPASGQRRESSLVMSSSFSSSRRPGPEDLGREQRDHSAGDPTVKKQRVAILGLPINNGPILSGTSDDQPRLTLVPKRQRAILPATRLSSRERMTDNCTRVSQPASAGLSPARHSGAFLSQCSPSPASPHRRQ